MKTFIVLGVQSSATSLVSKSLHSEISMGSKEKITPRRMGHPPTPNIYFEDMDFVKLNSKILQSAGGSWDNPPTEESILSQDFDEEILDLINRKSKGMDLWGWKDPRTSLTIKLYMKYLENPHFICCWRDPSETIASIMKRWGFPQKKAANIVRIYNLRIIRFLQCNISS